MGVLVFFFQIVLRIEAVDGNEKVVTLSFSKLTGTRLLTLNKLTT